MKNGTGSTRNELEVKLAKEHTLNQRHRWCWFMLLASVTPTSSLTLTQCNVCDWLQLCVYACVCVCVCVCVCLSVCVCKHMHARTFFSMYVTEGENHTFFWHPDAHDMDDWLSFDQCKTVSSRWTIFGCAWLSCSISYCCLKSCLASDSKPPGTYSERGEREREREEREREREREVDKETEKKREK